MECEEDAMRKMKLTASQRRKLRTRLRQTHDVRLYRRLLAVLAFDHGTAVSAIAELLGVSCQSVYNGIARFEQGEWVRTKRCTPLRAPASYWGSNQRVTTNAADSASGMVWLLRDVLDSPAIIEEPVTTEHGRAVCVGYDTPQAA